ncbi:MAG: hypothetical protein ACOX02_02315 [Acholeplasmatales bacterium]
MKQKTVIFLELLGAVPPHISKDQNISFDDLSIDTGMNKKELVDAGVEIGQMVLPKNTIFILI